MIKMLSRDARLFVDEVVKYVGKDKRGKTVAPRVQALLRRMTDAAKKERVASVVTAVLLSENEKNAAREMLVRLLGHDVECHFTVSEDILGGMKIQVADWVVDTSVSTQLTHLTQSLL